MSDHAHYVEQGYVNTKYYQNGITIDWGNKVIFIPKTEMVTTQTVPSIVRKLDLNIFRLALKELEESSDGMAFPRTHKHNTTVEVGGVILARVIEMVNDYTITFEDEAYSVNLTGANSNIGDVVNLNQVSVRSTNSAGLQDLSTLLVAAYSGEVAIHTVKGQSGITVPLGTRSTPVNNITDARTIADVHAIKTFRIMNSQALVGEQLSDGYTFIGDNILGTAVYLDPSINIANCEFRNLTLTGRMDGFNNIRECAIGDITYVNGFLFQCGLNSTIYIESNEQCTLIDCFSTVAGGTQTPTIDMGVDGSLAVRGFNGGLKITNYAGSSGVGDSGFGGPGGVSIDMSAGRVIIDSTCTGGTINIRGNCDIEDNSGPGCTINNKADLLDMVLTESYAPKGQTPTLSQALMLIQQILTEFEYVGNTLTVRKTDGTTEALTLSLDDPANPTQLRRD